MARTPWSAADAPVGLVMKSLKLKERVQGDPRDQGVRPTWRLHQLWWAAGPWELPYGRGSEGRYRDGPWGSGLRFYQDHWGGLAACHFVEEVFDAGIFHYLGHGVVDLQRLLEMDGLADGFP